MKQPRYYFSNLRRTGRYVNRWDLLTLVIILSLLFLLASGASQMAAPYQIGQAIPITLNPLALPHYAIRTMLRLFIALMISLLLTFIFGAWAAKSERAEKLIIPAVDILQSVPVLSFLSITIVDLFDYFPIVCSGLSVRRSLRLLRRKCGICCSGCINLCGRCHMI